MQVHKNNYDDALKHLKVAAEGELKMRKKKTRETRPAKFTEINALAEQFTKLFGAGTDGLESSYAEDVKKNIHAFAKKAATKTLETIHENYKKNVEDRAKNLKKFYEDMLDEAKKDEKKKVTEDHEKVAQEFDTYVQEMLLPKKKVVKKSILDTIQTKNAEKRKIVKRKTSGKKEETDPWVKAGQKPGLEIWRIEKLKVKPWPPKKYGTFYDGDTFIILNSYFPKGSKKLSWNVHFWIGSKCSIDERTVAAYKTVEVDEYLGGGPVQYREVQGHESAEFNKCFTNGIQVLSGGIDSGFNPKEPEKFVPKLLHLKGKRKVRVDEVPAKAESLNSGDAFILDCGLTVYAWLGKDSGRMEIYQARHISDNFKSDPTRRGVKVIELDEEGDDDFWEILGGKPDKIKTAKEGGDDTTAAKKLTHVLYKLSDASGKIEFVKVKDGPFAKDDLDENDAFIVDCDKKIFVWIGSGASKSESKLAMVYATDYLKKHNRPPFTPLLLLKSGQPNPDFYKRFK